MVADNFEIRAPGGSPNKCYAHHRRVLVPQANEKTTLTQQISSNNMPHSNRIEEMVCLMSAAQTMDMNPGTFLAKEAALHINSDQHSFLSEQTDVLQGMASKALKKRSKINIFEPYAPTNTYDHQCRRPQRNSRRSQKTESTKNDFSGLAHGVVRIDRSSGLPLGIRLNVTSCHIESVQWHGLVGAWNIDNPGQELKARDRIVAVNGHCKPDDILAECSKLQELLIEVERAQMPITERHQCRIDIDRSSAEPLGIVVDNITSEITSVSWKGLVGAWNIDHPEQSVRPGDRILQANGHSEANEIIAECQKLQCLHMVVERSWNIKESALAHRWNVQVSRDSEELLGIKLDIATLQVLSVSWRGLFGTWNIDNPAQVVKPGDKIIEVNGQRDASAIVAECHKSHSLRLLMERDGHRFHQRT